MNFVIALPLYKVSNKAEVASRKKSDPVLKQIPVDEIVGRCLGPLRCLSLFSLKCRVLLRVEVNDVATVLVQVGRGSLGGGSVACSSKHQAFFIFPYLKKKSVGILEFRKKNHLMK